MKKLLLLAGFALALSSGFAQEKKPVSPHETVTSGNMSVSYGRPYKKGRVIFGELEKYGKVWRTGANEATEITFKKDAVFAGKPVKAGTYTLFTIPTATDWTIILNSELHQWGAYGYEKIKDKNVLEATVPSKKLDKVVEQLTITPTGKSLTIAWDQTEVKIPVKF
ncbi:MAG TPA: DUF2911 domain-containing protein [Phnomibacter sp.]|nr:DUF2911 domain-containing protein [Phnomibacter sp.]